MHVPFQTSHTSLVQPKFPGSEDDVVLKLLVVNPEEYPNASCWSLDCGDGAQCFDVIFVYRLID
jgi:hypothetical protein